MKVLLTGATGFIGRKIAFQLSKLGHELVILARNPTKAQESLPQATFAAWDSLVSRPPLTALVGVEAVIHLAGEPVAEKRWSNTQKTRIYESRILGTRHLMEALKASDGEGPRVIVSASAIGFYGDRGDEVVDETSLAGSDFLAKVCVDWEREFFTNAPTSARKVGVRIGVVLGPDGGALAKLLPVFRTGMGGPVGSGKQWMSWIHVDDLVKLILTALSDARFEGMVNAVSPNPVRNREFAESMGHALHRPSIMPVPGFVLKLALGEMSEVVLGGARVLPKRAREFGFEFGYPELSGALQEIVKS